MAFGWPWELFEYNVRRKFESPRFTVMLLICGTVWITFITVLSLATVGYESKTVSTTDFNGTNKLWYDRILIRTPWIAESKQCQSSIIKLEEGMSPLIRLTSVISTAE